MRILLRKVRPTEPQSDHSPGFHQYPLFHENLRRHLLELFGSTERPPIVPGVSLFSLATGKRGKRRPTAALPSRQRYFFSADAKGTVQTRTVPSLLAVAIRRESAVAEICHSGAV